MVERNAEVTPDKRIVFRIGIHLGDVVEESDGDLMGDGVNIAARLEGIAKPGAICLSEDAYRQVSGRLDMEVTDLGPTQLKNIERPIRAYSLQVGVPAQAKPTTAAEWGPPQPDFIEGVGRRLQSSTVLKDGRKVFDIEEDVRRLKRRHKVMSRVGLGLIGVGFFAQLVAVWR
jgi:Adenylate and Guanylate cyclase catalytic domain